MIRLMLIGLLFAVAAQAEDSPGKISTSLQCYSTEASVILEYMNNGFYHVTSDVHSEDGTTGRNLTPSIEAAMGTLRCDTRAGERGFCLLAKGEQIVANVTQLSPKSKLWVGVMNYGAKGKEKETTGVVCAKY